MKREIVFDTETTGVDVVRGDRVIEIGCVELLNHIPTGRNWHAYINPERPVSQGAFEVHGLSDEFLKDKPVFSIVAGDFLGFIEDADLIAHNATFDVGFLNAEFARLNLPALVPDRVIDTLALARRKHPGSPNSLDALCSRYGIDNSRRTKHGALLDAEILAEVYIELLGGRQADLGLAPVLATTAVVAGATSVTVATRPAPLPSPLSEADLEAHATFRATLGPNAVWRDYIES